MPVRCFAFRQSLSMLPHIKEMLSSFSEPGLKDFAERLDDLRDLH